MIACYIEGLMKKENLLKSVVTTKRIEKKIAEKNPKIVRQTGKKQNESRRNKSTATTIPKPTTKQIKKARTKEQEKDMVSESESQSETENEESELEEEIDEEVGNWEGDEPKSGDTASIYLANEKLRHQFEIIRFSKIEKKWYVKYSNDERGYITFDTTWRREKGSSRNNRRKQYTECYGKGEEGEGSDYEDSSKKKRKKVGC